MRVAMSQVPCLHEHLANSATASSYAASVMVIKAEMEEKNMNSTALGAGAEKAQEIIFISEAHEKFYYDKLKEVRYQDVYHKVEPEKTRVRKQVYKTLWKEQVVSICFFLFHNKKRLFHNIGVRYRLLFSDIISISMGKEVILCKLLSVMTKNPWGRY